MTQKLKFSDLSTSAPTQINWVPDKEQTVRIAKTLELLGLRKVRLEGDLRTAGNSDWVLQARLGATVTQPCGVTLDPVTTRIDEQIKRHFVADWVAPEESELELEPGEESDPLPVILDLAELTLEALALALPLNPRSAAAELAQTDFAPTGVDPLTDESAKPFAGLADLKKKLENGD